jgi:hypothetical protein
MFLFEHMLSKFAKKYKHDLNNIFVTIQYGYKNLIPNEIASLYNRQNFFGIPVTFCVLA